MAHRWYHICFTYDLATITYKTYLDGSLVYEMKYDLKKPVYGDTASVGQGDMKHKSFSGEVTQVMA